MKTMIYIASAARFGLFAHSAIGLTLTSWMSKRGAERNQPMFFGMQLAINTVSVTEANGDFGELND